MSLKEYLENKNLESTFTAAVSDIGGNITFSNSGIRGTVKKFTLGLDSFLSILKDIESNIIAFDSHKDYVEKDWRDLGSEFFTDEPANAMSTVQTKPLFSTISKIVAWANYPDLESINNDQHMELNRTVLETAIEKLKELSDQYRIKEPELQISEEKEEADVDFKKYFSKFSASTFDEVKSNYPLLFNGVFNGEKNWMSPVEEKLDHIHSKEDRDAVKDVVEKLKKKAYLFTESDKDSLSTFSRVIDKVFSVTNFINNFTTKNLNASGIAIYDFFNIIKESNSIKNLNSKVRLQPTLERYIPYYFSVVKHCQDYERFPIFYKYWYTLFQNIFGKKIDYDTLTEYYRTFPEKERHLNFSAFWGALGKAILLEIKKNNNIRSKASKSYRKLLKLIPFEKYIEEIFALDSISANLGTRKFNQNSFYEACLEANFLINEKLVVRFIGSLLTKPFVVLTGLSGSGKTKLAQAFAMWICENENQYSIIPVGADWTNREPLLGFANALNDESYVLPDNGALNLITEASKNKNKNKPYFLILDEMNLSHVERYFADFLSLMESMDGKGISLHAGNDRSDNSGNIIPKNIVLPKNLFIVGTVNIDETTYMFSPKVLDRANVIEFRVTADEMDNYLNHNKSLNLNTLTSDGSEMSNDFLNVANNTSLKSENVEELNETLIIFFNELKKTGAEFGYRSAAEILRFSAIVNNIEPGWSMNEIIDACIMQKLLPKVHGSRRKLEPVLKTLGKLCLNEPENIENYFDPNKEYLESNPEIKYPISFEKILRMYQGLINNGFTSYAEA